MVKKKKSTHTHTQKPTKKQPIHGTLDKYIFFFKHLFRYMPVQRDLPLTGGVFNYTQPPGWPSGESRWLFLRSPPHLTTRGGGREGGKGGIGGMRWRRYRRHPGSAPAPRASPCSPAAAAERGGPGGTARGWGGMCVWWSRPRGCRASARNRRDMGERGRREGEQICRALKWNVIILLTILLTVSSSAERTTRGEKKKERYIVG